MVVEATFEVEGLVEEHGEDRGDGCHGGGEDKGDDDLYRAQNQIQVTQKEEGTRNLGRKGEARMLCVRTPTPAMSGSALLEQSPPAAATSNCTHGSGMTTYIG